MQIELSQRLSPASPARPAEPWSLLFQRSTGPLKSKWVQEMRSASSLSYISHVIPSSSHTAFLSNLLAASSPALMTPSLLFTLEETGGVLDKFLLKSLERKKCVG